MDTEGGRHVGGWGPATGDWVLRALFYGEDCLAHSVLSFGDIKQEENTKMPERAFSDCSFTVCHSNNLSWPSKSVELL